MISPQPRSREALIELFEELAEPVEWMTRGAAEGDRSKIVAAVRRIDQLGAWDECAALLSSAVTVAGTRSKWGAQDDWEERMQATASKIGEVWSGQAGFTPEIIFGISRRTAARLQPFERSGLVRSKTWSLHAALLLGYLTAGWAAATRWRVVILGLDHIDFDDPEARARNVQ